jgi:hypothetical protein
MLVVLKDKKEEIIMAKFRVWAKSISYVYLDVEAENVHEAMMVADEVDGGDFHEDSSGWEFSDDVEEIDNDADVDYTFREVFGEEV